MNGELARGSYVGAVGGALDFVRAANQSPGGVSILPCRPRASSRNCQGRFRCRAARPASLSANVGPPICAAARCASASAPSRHRLLLGRRLAKVRQCRHPGEDTIEFPWGIRGFSGNSFAAAGPGSQAGAVSRATSSAGWCPPASPFRWRWATACSRFIALGNEYFPDGALAGLVTAVIVGIVCVALGDKSSQRLRAARHHHVLHRHPALRPGAFDAPALKSGGLGADHPGAVRHHPARRRVPGAVRPDAAGHADPAHPAAGDVRLPERRGAAADAGAARQPLRLRQEHHRSSRR